MPAKSSIEFKRLDAAHALAAKDSLAMAMPHLAEASRNLEFGVPYEMGAALGLIITYVDCATNLVEEAIKGLKDLPDLPQKEG